MTDSQTQLATSSNALQELSHIFYNASKSASARIQGNLRIEALQKETSVTERFWAYMEMGLDGQQFGDFLRLKVTAIPFTDRADNIKKEIDIGADMACFVRYDLPGLRWAKGFIGQSKLAKVNGFHPNGMPKVGLADEASYDTLIQQCAAMGNLTDESYVFFFSSESVTVEKANNLLGDLGESYPDKPWQDVHQYRQEPPVNIAQFYGAVAACQLGETLLDRPVLGDKRLLDLVKTRQIETVLLLLVGTNPPQKPIRRDSLELKHLATPVPESYWLWPDLVQTLTNR
jgi:hypothetical protein